MMYNSIHPRYSNGTIGIKQLFNIFILLFIMVNLIGCFKSEINDSYYPNGNIMVHNEMKNGKPHGTIITYKITGDTISLERYRNGKKEGVSIQFMDQFVVKSKYHNDIQEGPMFFCKRNGEVLYELNYKDDQLDGLCKLFDNDGKIKYQCNFKANKPIDGIWGASNMPPVVGMPKLRIFKFDNGNIVDTLQ